MTKQFTIVYISLTGNTHNFVTRLVQHLHSTQNDWHINTINVKDLVRGQEDYFALTDPCIAFLPTYLEGGNGVETGYTEILTNPLGDFLAYQHNYQHCLGIVGGGNRNFNKQFCLTAKQYAQRFGFPVLDEFELRGNAQDIERISQKIIQILSVQ